MRNQKMMVVNLPLYLKSSYKVYYTKSCILFRSCPEEGLGVCKTSWNYSIILFFIKYKNSVLIINIRIRSGEVST